MKFPESSTDRPNQGNSPPWNGRSPSHRSHPIFTWQDVVRWRRPLRSPPSLFFPTDARLAYPPSSWAEKCIRYVHVPDSPHGRPIISRTNCRLQLTKRQLHDKSLLPICTHYNFHANLPCMVVENSRSTPTSFSFSLLLLLLVHIITCIATLHSPLEQRNLEREE